MDTVAFKCGARLERRPDITGRTLFWCGLVSAVFGPIIKTIKTTVLNDPVGWIV